MRLLIKVVVALRGVVIILSKLDGSLAVALVLIFSWPVLADCKLAVAVLGACCVVPDEVTGIDVIDVELAVIG